MDKIQLTKKQVRDMILAQYQYSGSKLDEEEIQARILNLKQAGYIKKDKDIVEETDIVAYIKKQLKKQLDNKFKHGDKAMDKIQFSKEQAIEIAKIIYGCKLTYSEQKDIIDRLKKADYIKQNLTKKSENKCCYERIKSEIPYPRAEWKSECNFKLCIIQGFIIDGTNPTNILRPPTGKCMKCGKEITTVSKKDIVEEAEEMFAEYEKVADKRLEVWDYVIQKQHEAIQYLKSVS